MDSIKRLNETKKRLADVYISDKQQIEYLRHILREELGRDVSLPEAREFGTNLIGYYQALAGTRRITKGGLKNITAESG